MREAFGLEEAEDAFGFGGEVGERASRAVRGRADSGARTPRLARAGEQCWRGRCADAAPAVAPRNVRRVARVGSRGEGSWYESGVRIERLAPALACG